MIYLDSAATTFRKPASVRRAVNEALSSLASPGRGGYGAAMRASELCYVCRETAGTLFGCAPERVAFTSSATHGLNIAINTLVQPGDRVVISGYEHNAVTRTLVAQRAEISVASGGLFAQDEILRSFERLLPGARCCVATHVSNVFGYILPIDEIAQMCRYYEVPRIVDASQSAGSLPVRMDVWNAAFVAMPGHKGLHGIQGTGLLLCGMQPEPLLCGGTGSASLRQSMPEELPDRIEAGTHNMPGIAGLLAGMRYVQRLGEENIARHEAHLRRLLAGRLRRLPGIEIFETDGEEQAGVLSIRSERIDCERVASMLAAQGVAVRVDCIVRLWLMKLRVLCSPAQCASAFLP